MSKVPGMCFFYDWREAFELMSPADCKKMLLAMLDFSRNGTEPPEFEDPKAKMAAMFIFSQMRRSQMKAEIGKRGGEKSIQNRLKPVVEPVVEPEIEPEVEGCLNPKLNINIIKTKQDIYETRQDDITAADAPKQKPKTGFKIPLVDEVSAYCSERHNSIDPDKFVDYYTAQGWKLSNGQPMKDWKAAVRNWEHRNKEHQVNTGSFDEDEFLKAALARTYGGE